MTAQTFKIYIKGRVQGVGFRPFVYRLAQDLKIKGTVSNDAEGVVIFITASAKAKDNFLKALLAQRPEVSIVQDYNVTEVSEQLFNDFKIIPSQVTSNLNLPLTPDFAVCKTCKKEINDPSNRRYGYPFTTCVHCGPRYAITTRFPFERAYTSLVDFEMCTACEQEYKDPTNRRFHSQTNSCSDCGIQLMLVDTSGNQVSADTHNILLKTAAFIADGKIIAIKNTNGYLLCCDATQPEAIAALRIKKKRPNKPFAVLYPSIERVSSEFSISDKERELLSSTVGPIVILENTERTNIATKAIAPYLKQTGVMLPSSALLALLMDAVKNPIVCTSGNIHGSPIISESQIAQAELSNVADYFVHHNLPIQFPQDDSVVKIVDEKPVWLRRSRGIAPNFFSKNDQSKNVSLAMGAHLKSTFALVPNAHTYVSQYFGNLDNYDVLKRFKNTIEKQLAVFNCIPTTILIDAHPSYQSSLLGPQLASDYGSKLISIQHHKAHFASVLAEHHLFNTGEKILGVVWDGTGYGDDGAIWGGEFFVYENATIERINHFEYYDWLANNKMAQEPRLALLSLLSDENNAFAKAKFSSTEWKIYSKMLQNNILKTSSVGRLFDAVASALDLKDINTFEAEAPMLLENCAKNYKQKDAIDFLENVEYDRLPSKQIINALVRAYSDGGNKERLAFSFIYTLAKSIVTLSRKRNLKIIACSGGVFQNSLLIEVLSRLCKNHKIKIKFNCKLCSNDENISLGQLAYFQNIKN